jgi:hypothetical protein
MAAAHTAMVNPKSFQLSELDLTSLDRNLGSKCEPRRPFPNAGGL